VVAYTLFARCIRDARAQRLPFTAVSSLPSTIFTGSAWRLGKGSAKSPPSHCALQRKLRLREIIILFQPFDALV
jgi:hypothetical protein